MTPVLRSLWTRPAGVGLLMIVLLGGCAALRANDPKDWAVIVVDLKPVDETPRMDQAATLERAWLGFGLAPRSAKEPAPTGPTTVQVRLRTGPTDAEDPQASGLETFEIQNVDIGRPRTATGDEVDGPVVVTLDSPAASLTLTGGLIEWPYGREKVVGGVSRVTFNREFLAAAREAEPTASTITLLRAALLGLSASEMLLYHRLELQPDLDEVIELVQAGVSAGVIESYYAAGYGLSSAELIRLRVANVDVDDAVAFRRDGFELNADELILLREQDVSPTYARGMKRAGFAEDVSMLVRLRNAGVDTAYANEMRRLNVVPNETSLLKLHRARIAPETVETYQRARYRPTAEQLITLQEAGVKADDALALRDGGYNFTQEELIKFARWRVPAPYILSLMSPDYEPLNADQIVDMRLRTVTPEMVRLLRQPRSGSFVKDPNAEDADAVDASPGAVPITLPDLPPLDPVEPEPVPGG